MHVIMGGRACIYKRGLSLVSGLVNKSYSSKANVWGRAREGRASKGPEVTKGK